MSEVEIVDRIIGRLAASYGCDDHAGQNGEYRSAYDGEGPSEQPAGDGNQQTQRGAGCNLFEHCDKNLSLLGLI